MYKVRKKRDVCLLLPTGSVNMAKCHVTRKHNVAVPQMVEQSANNTKNMALIPPVSTPKVVLDNTNK